MRILTATLQGIIAIPRRLWQRSTGPDPVVALSSEVDRRRAVEAELERMRRDVEQRVRQRTRELERANAILLAQRERLTRLAMHDSLTGLPNRRLLLELLGQEAERARRSNGRFALLLADVDRFKPVNDRYGHTAGDRLLVHIARRMAGAVRACDVVARLGGDEFAVLVREPLDASAVATLAARIKVTVEAPYRLGEFRVSVGLSLGAALHPIDGGSVATMLEVADRRLYARKRAPNGCRPFRPLRLAWPPAAGAGEEAEPTSCGTGRG